MEFSHRLVWMQMGSAEAPSTPFRSVKVSHWVAEREGAMEAFVSISNLAHLKGEK